MVFGNSKWPPNSIQWVRFPMYEKISRELSILDKISADSWLDSTVTRGISGFIFLEKNCSVLYDGHKALRQPYFLKMNLKIIVKSNNRRNYATTVYCIVGFLPSPLSPDKQCVWKFYIDFSLINCTYYTQFLVAMLPLHLICSLHNLCSTSGTLSEYMNLWRRLSEKS